MVLADLLRKRITEKIAKWKQRDIYAISLLMTYHELSIYDGIKNFPEISIGYNTEKYCGSASLLSEERWNYAYWEQNNEVILDNQDTVGADLLLKWWSEQGISCLDYESEDEMYDENMNYIGKGPNGFFELVNLISDIVLDLQNSGVVREKFGSIPVIIHDLEYSWYTINATKKANPNGEADCFLEYLKLDS